MVSVRPLPPYLAQRFKGWRATTYQDNRAWYRRLAEAGWTRTELGTVIRTLGDGTWLGEYFNGDQRMDIILRGNGWSTPEELAQVALATPGAGVQLMFPPASM